MTNNSLLVYEQRPKGFLHDVAVIGSGPAGLTATATLARRCHKVLLFQSMYFRCDQTSPIHMVPGWENKSHRGLRWTIKTDIMTNYSSFVEFASTPAAWILKNSNNLFTVRSGSGEDFFCRKILLAIGSYDSHFPNLLGFPDLWATRIFYPLYCPVHQLQGSIKAGVLANPQDGVQQLKYAAANAARISASVTIYTNGNFDLAEELIRNFEHEFVINASPIACLMGDEAADTIILEHTDKTRTYARFLLYQPTTTVLSELVGQLGLALTAQGNIQVDTDTHQTNIEGVFAAGDCMTEAKLISHALSSGCRAALGICDAFLNQQ